MLMLKLLRCLFNCDFCDSVVSRFSTVRLKGNGKVKLNFSRQFCLNS